MKEKKERIKYLITHGLYLLLAGILYMVWFQNTGIGIPCPFRVWTGLYCPGCGVTRCLIHLMKFQFLEAFYSNMLIVLTMPFLLFFIFLSIYQYIKDGKIKFKRRQEGMLWALVALFLLFGFFRNLPGMEWMCPRT